MVSGARGCDLSRDRLETPDGLTAVKLRPSSSRAISVKGKGSNLHLPVSTLAPPLIVQLVRTGSGACWEANFSTLVSVGARISTRSD